MTEWIKDSDFALHVPYEWKKRKIKDANNAMEIEARLTLQIAHWEKLPDENMHKHVMLDELYYLRDGKV